jgi:hypothetical protein
MSSSAVRSRPYLWALALVAVLVFTLMGPGVRAAHATHTCNVNRLCVWEHTGGNGAQYDYGTEWRNRCVNIGSAWNDRISSARNRLPWKIVLRVNANCGSWSFNMGPNTVVNDLHAYFMGDAVSSIWFY